MQQYMNPIKIIFLDIDGVINTTVNIRIRKQNGESTCADYIKLPGDKIYRLRQICEYANAKVVVSSSWRIGFSRQTNTPSPAYVNFVNQVAPYGIDIIGWTPLHTDRNRGREISHWLHRFEKYNKYTPKYVIIDDDIQDLLDLHRGHIIKTTTLLGLQDQHVNIAVNLLNN